MANGNPTRLIAALTLFCLAINCVQSWTPTSRTTSSSTGKPLMKRPPGGTFKVLLFVDGGGARGIITVVMLMEIERSIKQYLLNNPQYLPTNAFVSTVDDFDINLVDYVDCMTAVSGGAWTVLYLASRGGKGASRKILDDPAVVANYGVIPSGTAEGLRVFYREYMSMVYPLQSLDLSAGTPFNLSDPQAPGVSSPLFTTDGLESALEAFLGHTTMADLDCSVMIPAVDMITGYTVFFVQNAFRHPPVSSSARLVSRAGPRAPPGEGGGFLPDFRFDEGKDYYTKDVGTAASVFPPIHSAKPVSQIGNSAMEYTLVDGAFSFEVSTIPAAYFVSTESKLFDPQKVAVISAGSVIPIPDFSPLVSAGVAGWAEQSTTFFLLSGFRSLTSLADYIYYSNPATLPYQYLRMQLEVPATSEIGVQLSTVTDPDAMDTWEAIGRSFAESYRSSIDTFVEDFIFG